MEISKSKSLFLSPTEMVVKHLSSNHCTYQKYAKWQNNTGGTHFLGEGKGLDKWVGTQRQGERGRFVTGRNSWCKYRGGESLSSRKDIK